MLHLPRIPIVFSLHLFCASDYDKLRLIRRNLLSLCRLSARKNGGYNYKPFGCHPPCLRKEIKNHVERIPFIQMVSFTSSVDRDRTAQTFSMIFDLYSPQSNTIGTQLHRSHPTYLQENDNFNSRDLLS